MIGNSMATKVDYGLAGSPGGVIVAANRMTRAMTKNLQPPDKLLTSVAAAVARGRFDAQRESIPECIRLSELTHGQIVWVSRQPVVGRPNLPRLMRAVELAGLSKVRIKRAASGEHFEFEFVPQDDVTIRNTGNLLRLLIRRFRSAGFDVGFEDVCLHRVESDFVLGRSYTRSINLGPRGF